MRILTLLLTCCIAWPLASAEKIYVASGEYPPFSGKALPHEGYISHMVALAFESEGVTVKYHYLPWARSLEETVAGLYPASIFWFCHQDRRANFYCSEQPVETEEVNIFRRKDKPLGEWESYRDLRQYKFGLTRGYAYDEAFLNEVKEGKLRAETVNSDVQNMNKLLSGRVDLFLIGEEAGMDVLEQYFSPEERAQIAVEPRPISVSDFHVLFPKQHPDALELRAKFDRGMIKLREAGRLEQLRADFLDGKYNLQKE